MKQLFEIDDPKKWLDLGKGVSRKVLANNEELMLVKVKFDQDAIGEEHHHVHVQISYVLSGVFVYTIGDQQRTLRQGDSCIVPSNVRHGCKCIEAGVLLDSFTPRRNDFI